MLLATEMSKRQNISRQLMPWSDLIAFGVILLLDSILRIFRLQIKLDVCVEVRNLPAASGRE